jgi:UDP-N-acetylglucosamine 4-epimerase
MANVLEMQMNENFQFIYGSILDGGLLRSIIKTEKISRISHNAAISNVQKSNADPVKTVETNITGTANVFHLAAEYRCKRVIFSSSSLIYGDTSELFRRETMERKPKSLYAMSKAAQEMLGIVFSGLYPIEIVGLRYFNVNGRRQDPASDYAAVIPKFIMKALHDEPIIIEGDGCQIMDFIYIDDVVSANLKALFEKNTADTVFNIAYGEQTNILDLANAILDLTDSNSEVIFNPEKSGDVQDSIGDIEQATKQLGFCKNFPIELGLAETINWYRNKVDKRCAA